MSGERVSIIGGAGAQGAGLALRWAAAGYEVVVGSRDAGRAREAAARVKAALGGAARVSGAANPEAAAAASVVVLTVPFAAQFSALKQVRERLAAGSLLVDVTVPLEPAVGGRPGRVLGVWAGSAAEQCAELAPEGVAVVSAFHNVAAARLTDLGRQVECDVLVCGDSREAKERARPLVEAIPGCRFIDGGALSNSRTVESLTALLIDINTRYRTHAGIRLAGLEARRVRAGGLNGGSA